MNIRQFRIFKTVCELGTITAAAEKLYMSQPAISHAIHDLEVEIGFQLFDRIAKKIYLNTQGELFLAKVEHVLESYDDLTRSLSHMEQESPLHIGSCITIANYWLPELMHSYHKLHPDVCCYVEVDRAANVLAKLHDHRLDIALFEGVIEDERLVHLPFSSYELKAVCSVRHPFASREMITLEELLQEPLLLREKGSAIRDTFDSAIKLHGQYVKPLWTSVNSQALLQAVRENLGISILPDRLADTAGDDVHVLSLQDLKLVNENQIVYVEGKYLSKQLRQFLAYVQDFGSSMKDRRNYV